MSFIPKDEPEPKLAPDAVEEVKETEPDAAPATAEKKPNKGNALRSAFWLILILLGLFVAKPYLTGEQDLGQIPSLDFSATKGGSVTTVTELKVPTMMGDREMRKLMAEFKEGYERIVPQEEITMTQPRVRAAKFSKDRRKLLIELEQAPYTPAPPVTDEAAEETVQAAPGSRTSQDVIFVEDEFGRLITAGRLAGIKLYPMEQE